ncbi:MAG TPA: hypothetical protein VK152_05850, partial [Paludibacter sp.]|nr:hypothetical protein [Paludibacter sp.]
MVLVQVQNIQTASVLLASASKLAGQLKKAFGILYLIDMDEQYAQAEIALDNLLDGLELADFQCFIRKSKPG